MDRNVPSDETVQPTDPLSSDYPYQLALWGGVVLAAGLSLARLAANLAFDPNPEAVAPVWGGLGILVAILGGSAISLRPRSTMSWLGGAVTAGLLSAGAFGDWDSIQLLFRVGAVVCAIVVVMLSVPLQVRLAFFGGCLTLHFLGILSAVTSPDPQPWISGQAWTRVFRPYLHFTYMNNAYQFYSPDPGPARQLWFCIEYIPKEGKEALYPMPPKPDEKGRQEKGYYRWLKVPVRPEQYTDPLGQAYFRRLSITEYTAQFQPNNTRTEVESKVLNERRNTREDIPRVPTAAFGIEYQPPTVLVQKAYLPSYVRHVARLAEHPDFDIRSIKFYRITHRMLEAKEFVTINDRPPTSPYDPTTYLPYFQGEFDKDGNLLRPFDPLLFWHLTIRLKPNVTDYDPEKFQRLLRTNYEAWRDEYHRCFDDYVTAHAGYDHTKGGNLP